MPHFEKPGRESFDNSAQQNPTSPYNEVTVWVDVTFQRGPQLNDSATRQHMKRVSTKDSDDA